eukprot:1157426-Pelagomonas_calceolata.AAC.11
MWHTVRFKGRVLHAWLLLARRTAIIVARSLAGDKAFGMLAVAVMQTCTAGSVCGEVNVSLDAEANFFPDAEVNFFPGAKAYVSLDAQKQMCCLMHEGRSAA